MLISLHFRRLFRIVFLASNKDGPIRPDSFPKITFAGKTVKGSNKMTYNFLSEVSATKRWTTRKLFKYDITEKVTAEDITKLKTSFAKSFKKTWNGGYHHTIYKIHAI